MRRSRLQLFAWPLAVIAFLMVLATSVPALAPAWADESGVGLASVSTDASIEATGNADPVTRDEFTVRIEPEPAPAPVAADTEASPPPPAQGALAPVSGGASPAAILADLNAQRAAAGLAPFAAHDGLMGVAQQWSVAQAQSSTMYHNPGFAGQTTGVGCGGATENVASAMGSISPVQAWMDSPPHRANILSAATHLGVGAATAANGLTYYTLNFASC